MSYRGMSRPRILNQELTQHSDLAGPSSGHQPNRPPQRLDSSYMNSAYCLSNESPPSKQLQVQICSYSPSISSNPATPHSQWQPRESLREGNHFKSQRHVLPSGARNEAYSKEPTTPYTWRRAPHGRKDSSSLNDYQTKLALETRISMPASLHWRDTPTPSSGQWEQNAFDNRQIHTSTDKEECRPEDLLSVRFDLSSDEDKLKNMVSEERSFYGGVDQVLGWNNLIKSKQSSPPGVKILFTVTGIVESMLTREGMQVILLRSTQHVLQCIYYIIDRKLPSAAPSSYAFVTGNMVGSKKIIIHDMSVLKEEEYLNLSRMSYLSERAVSRYLSDL